MAKKIDNRTGLSFLWTVLFFWLTLLLISPGSLRAEQEQPSPATDAMVNIVEWTTASESDNFGFDVYRGESPEGPFVKISTTPVPGAGNTDETTHYTFTDDTVQTGVQYYYYVESISLSGVRERFTPVFKAPIKASIPAQIAQ